MRSVPVPRRLRMVVPWILPLVLLGMLAFSLLPALYVHPLADDLDYASTTRESGFFVAWLQQYSTWNGRYSSMAVALATPMVFGSLLWFRVALSAIVLATVAVVYGFLSTIAARSWSRGEILTCTLAVTTIYVSQMPGFGEGLFWYTSSAIYQAAIVLAVAHVTAVVRFLRTGRRRWMVLGSALLVCAIGFNEVLMFALVVFYAVLSVWSARSSDRHRGLVWTQFAIAVISAAVVIFAPGNAARAAVYPDRHQLVPSIAMTFLQTFRFLGDWASNGVLLVGSVLFAPMGARLARELVPDGAQRRSLQMLSAAGAAVIVPLVVFPPYWATGILGGHRTANVGFFVFLLLWFIAIAMWAGQRDAGGDLQWVVHQLRVPLVILFVIGISCTHNSYRLWLDALRGHFAQFDSEMTAREATLRSCHARREETCTVVALHDVPGSLFFLEGSVDRRDWVNAAYARYYGLGSVVVETDR